MANNAYVNKVVYGNTTLIDISDTTTTITDVASGKIFYGANGEQLTGSMPQKTAATYNTSTSDQTISANQYLTGIQTIKAVTTSNLIAANIASGVTIKVGDANDDDRIVGITGTFTNDATATAEDIISGKTAYVSGREITGTLVVNNYYTGTEVPSSSLGQNGDIYIQQ